MGSGRCPRGHIAHSLYPLFPQMLARLLKSSHPEDLRAANKLIKEMVQEVSVGQGAGVLSWTLRRAVCVPAQGAQTRPASPHARGCHGSHGHSEPVPA